MESPTRAPQREDPGIPYTLDHVAFGVADVEAAARFLVGELGGRPHQGGANPAFDFWQWSFGPGEKIELIAPAGPPDGFLRRFLARRGPGPHHVTFYVRDLSAACARARRAGFDVQGEARFPGWEEAFLHPKQAQGSVVQLACSTPRDDASLVPGWRFPEVAAAATPVRLVDLVLSARDEKAARRLWGELLGGALEAAASRLRFRWPGNPMGLAVEIDAARPEGPLRLEVASERPLALPEGPVPALGAVFRTARDGT